MKGHVYKPNCKCPKGSRCRCNAKWGYLVDVGINPATGKRKQKFKGGFGTKREAEESLSTLLATLGNGSFVDPAKMTFSQLSEEFIEHFKEETKQKNGKPGTIRQREYQTARLKEKMGFAKVKNITKKQYREVLDEIKKSRKVKKGPSPELSDNTMSGIHAAGSMIFGYAKEKGYVAVDPTLKARPIKKKKTLEELKRTVALPKYMEKEELLIFLDAVEKYGLEGDVEAFHTIAYSGMRVGEYCALRFPNLDFKANTISIEETLYNPTNSGLGYELVTAKTTRSIRTFKMDKDVMKKLKALQIRHKERKLRSPNYFDGQFVSAIGLDRKYAGHPETVNRIEYRMHRITKMIGFSESLTPHSLRHTHVSLLAEAKVPLEVIMDRLGHGDDDITRLIYMHVTEHLKEEAADKFSALMNSLR